MHSLAGIEVVSKELLEIYSYVSFICVLKICMCEIIHISALFHPQINKKCQKFLLILWIFKNYSLSYLSNFIIDLSFFDYSSEHHQNSFIKFVHYISFFVWLVDAFSLCTYIFILYLLPFYSFMFICCTLLATLLDFL